MKYWHKHYTKVKTIRLSLVQLHLFVMGYKSKYGNHLLSLSEGYELIARYNREYGSVEIADLTQNPPEWVDYDPSRGASDKVLTFHCDSLYDRALLQELGV